MDSSMLGYRCMTEVANKTTVNIPTQTRNTPSAFLSRKQKVKCKDLLTYDISPIECDFEREDYDIKVNFHVLLLRKVYTPPNHRTSKSPYIKISNALHNTSKLQSTNTRMSTNTPNTLQPSRRAIAHPNRVPGTTLAALLATAGRQNSKAQDNFRRRDQDTEDDQHDDDPGDAGHLDVGDLVREDLGEVEEDAAALVQDLDARFDLEVFAYTLVERVESGFGVPEEFGGVEHVACCGSKLLADGRVEVSGYFLDCQTYKD
jgi:hypothetical protein